MVDFEMLKRVIVENQQFIASIELNRRDYVFEPKGRYVLVGAGLLVGAGCHNA